MILLLRFLAARGRDAGFLVPTGFALVFLAISAPVTPTLTPYHSSGHDVVTVGPKKSPGHCPGVAEPENGLKFNDFFAAPGLTA